MRGRLAVSWEGPARPEPEPATVTAWQFPARSQLAFPNGSAFLFRFEQSVKLVERSDQIVLIVVRKGGKLLNDSAHALALIVEQGFFAVVGQPHVDLTLVARVDAALDQRARAIFQGADNARHLRRQDAQHALDIADDQRAVAL